MPHNYVRDPIPDPDPGFSYKCHVMVYKMDSVILVKKNMHIALVYMAGNIAVTGSKTTFLATTHPTHMHTQ